MRNLFIADVIWQTMRILLGFSTKTKTNMMMEGKESGYVARNPNNTVHDINRNDDDGNDDVDHNKNVLMSRNNVLVRTSDTALTRTSSKGIKNLFGRRPVNQHG